MMLTERDLNILGALNHQVRVLTVPQIAATWWPATESGQKNAGRRLLRLRQSALIERELLLAQPLLPLRWPVLSWQPGDDSPPCGTIAWQLQTRWSGHPRRTGIWFATRHSLRHFGGTTPGRIKNRCQVTHDLHVSSIYLLYLQQWPEQAAQWLGEDAFAPHRRGEKLPDAVLVDAAGEPLRAIEFGGSYSARRVAAFHADCAARELPYELW